MVVPAPEPTTRVPFPEAREGFEHFLGSVGFEHDLRGLDRVPFWDVDQEMHVVEGEAEVAELEPEAFQVVERLEEDVDVDLLSKQLYLLWVTNIIVTQLLRVSPAIFLGLPLDTISILAITPVASV